ncbi:elongation factor 4 [Striga asiatica]|uniref:Elongation factor 4 n=1 Tax=Striga asiatica TaxID=4170 RepID=A0A5A7RCB5_STRAF|nr:elongation factor 4 [Striga asiatica]
MVSIRDMPNKDTTCLYIFESFETPVLRMYSIFSSSNVVRGIKVGRDKSMNIKSSLLRPNDSYMATAGFILVSDESFGQELSGAEQGFEIVDTLVEHDIDLGVEEAGPAVDHLHQVTGFDAQFGEDLELGLKDVNIGFTERRAPLENSRDVALRATPFFENAFNGRTSRGMEKTRLLEVRI